MTQATSESVERVERLRASTAEDEPLYEVVDGQRVELPPMGAYETWLASVLITEFGLFLKDQALGRAVSETLFAILTAPNRQRRPDVAFVSYERWPRQRRVPSTAAWDVVPDLTVEVISPTDTATDVVMKVREYFTAGVPQHWVVYPGEALIYVYESARSIRVLERGDELDGGAVLPGFRLPLANLFEPEDA